MAPLEWPRLLSTGRFKTSEKAPDARKKTEDLSWLLSTSRTAIERDHDRILFSAPVRRLANKTQVFPLDKNISIRNRLTHSYEVANLARSIGTYLATEEAKFEDFSKPNLYRDIPAILAAIGLAHDLGNPPFGHQGEFAIRSWFKNRPDEFWKDLTQDQWKEDFLNFEGNAQTIRVITRLQHADSPYGLNLSYATLAALMKYPVASHQVNEDAGIASKKFGFFASEEKLVNAIWAATGLGSGIRHPLTFIMEACDDIAYSVLDVEDGIKKQLISFSDLMAELRKAASSGDECLQWVLNKSEEDHQILLDNKERTFSPAELNDVSTQKFRVYAIHAMISAAIEAFRIHSPSMMAGTFTKELVKESKAATLCKTLKKFAQSHCFKHRSVLEIELQGYNIIHELMEYLWEGIVDREHQDILDSKRNTPFANYAYHRISENYRCVFEGKRNTSYEVAELPIRYRECQLLTDMISGMADGYALELCKELRSLKRAQ